MAVVVNCIGRIGNNLFQYCIGRIIAEALNVSLHCVADPSLDLTTQPRSIPPPSSLHSLASYFPKMKLQPAAIDLSQPTERYTIGGGLDRDGNRIDLHKVIANRRHRTIVLQGYFQRYEYYSQYHRKIRRWLETDVPSLDICTQSDDIVVNVRRGMDFGLLNWRLPLDYYTSILDGMKQIGHVYICGTCIDDSTVRAFEKYRPTYLDHLPPIYQLEAIKKFNRIVASNSTFAWWAAYLSRASEIYAPHNPTGDQFAFTGYRTVDLDMRDMRYRPVTVSYSDELVFRAGRVSEIESDNNKRNSIIVRTSKATITMDVKVWDSECVRWILTNQSMMSYSDIRRHYIGSDFPRFAAALLSVGVLSCL